MYYGSGAGCSFLENACSQGPLAGRRECCSSASVDVASDFYYKNKGLCHTDKFSYDTLYISPYINVNCEYYVNLTSGTNYYCETFSKGSRCLIGSVLLKPYSFPSPTQISLCYKTECINGKVIIYLTLGEQITCNYKDETVSTSATGKYTGSIICPDPVEFCKLGIFLIFMKIFTLMKVKHIMKSVQVIVQ